MRLASSSWSQKVTNISRRTDMRLDSTVAHPTSREYLDMRREIVKRRCIGPRLNGVTSTTWQVGIPSHLRAFVKPSMTKAWCPGPSCILRIIIPCGRASGLCCAPRPPKTPPTQILLIEGEFVLYHCSVLMGRFAISTRWSEMSSRSSLVLALHPLPTITMHRLHPATTASKCCRSSTRAARSLPHVRALHQQTPSSGSQEASASRTARVEASRLAQHGRKLSTSSVMLKKPSTAKPVTVETLVAAEDVSD